MNSILKERFILPSKLREYIPSLAGVGHGSRLHCIPNQEAMGHGSWSHCITLSDRRQRDEGWSHQTFPFFVSPGSPAHGIGPAP